MSSYSWLQLGVLTAILLVSTRVLGAYIAGVFGGGRALGDRVFAAGRAIALPRVRGRSDARAAWPVYALALIAFSLVSVLGLYLLQRVQGSLPLDPTDAKAVPPALAFNTAVSLRHEHELAELRWRADDEPPHPDGGARGAELPFRGGRPAVAVALIRGFVRRRSATIGNFWVDLTRGTIRVLLPLAIVVAILLASQGVVQNFHGFTDAATVQGVTQTIPGGPIASQEAIKELGENGGGSVQRQLGSPVRERQRLHEPARDLHPPDDPVRAHLHLRPAGQGSAPGVGAVRGDVLDLARGRRPGDALRERGQPEARGDRRRAAATWRARRCASAPPCPVCSLRPRPAPRPARSTLPTTATRHSAARCRSCT